MKVLALVLVLSAALASACTDERGTMVVCTCDVVCHFPYYDFSPVGEYAACKAGSASQDETVGIIERECHAENYGWCEDMATSECSCYDCKTVKANGCL